MAEEGETGQGDEGKESSHARSQRGQEQPVTDFESFAAAWPLVSEQVAHVLRQRGADSETIRDVTQETGLRAIERLGKGLTFDSTRGMYRWTRLVAVNIVTDRWRADRESPVNDLDYEAPLVDLDAMVQWRTLLAEVVRVLPRLPHHERRALLDLLAGTPLDDPRHRGRQGMRLYRARQRLRRWTGGLPAGWRWRLRWVVDLLPLGALSVGFVATAALVAQAPEPMPTHVVTTVSREVEESSVPDIEPSPVTSVPGRRSLVNPLKSLPEPVPARATVVEMPKPLGGTTRAGVSENSPDKALVCVESDVVDLCVDKPGLP